MSYLGRHMQCSLQKHRLIAPPDTCVLTGNEDVRREIEVLFRDTKLMQRIRNADPKTEVRVPEICLCTISRSYDVLCNNAEQ